MGCILRPPLGSQIGLHEFQCVVFWFQSRTSGFVNTGTGSHDRAAHRRTARTEICTSTSPAKTGTTRDKQKCSRISSPVVFLCPSTPVLNDLPEPILVKWQRQMESGHKRARLAACKPKPRHCDALKHFFKLSKSLRGLVTFISEASRLITKSLCKFGHSWWGNGPGPHSSSAHSRSQTPSSAAWNCWHQLVPLQTLGASFFFPPRENALKPRTHVGYVHSLENSCIHVFLIKINQC